MWEKYQDLMKEDCLNKNQHSNYQKNIVFSKNYNIFKREKKIMEVNYRRNIAFTKARKIAEPFMNYDIYNNEE